MTFQPLTKEDVFDGQTEVCYDYYVELKDVRSAVEGLKSELLVGVHDVFEGKRIEFLINYYFPVFSQSLSEDAKINDGCSQQVTSAPSSEAKSSVSHHVSMGAATESVAAETPCNCKHGSGAITKRFVEENKLCKCECHKEVKK